MKGVVFQLCGIFHVLHLKCHTLVEPKRFLDLIWRRGSLSFYRVNYGLQRSFWENPWTFSIWSSKMAAILPYYVHHSSKIRGLDSKKCSSEMLQNLLLRNPCIFFSNSFRATLYKFISYESSGLCRVSTIDI